MNNSDPSQAWQNYQRGQPSKHKIMLTSLTLNGANQAYMYTIYETTLIQP